MKYYKIFNEEENHHGLQYHTGLVEDILPFNPSGNCEPGGIYFASEDILAFLEYGPWIREVIIPDNEEIYENPSIPKKYKVHKVILGERERITLDTLKRLVSEGANIHANDDCALRWASRNDHLDIVKYLVSEDADIHANNDYALRWVSYKGHLDIVKIPCRKQC